MGRRATSPGREDSMARRLFHPCLGLALVVAGALLAFACDPDLTPVKAGGGDGGKEGGVGPGPGPSGTDGGTTETDSSTPPDDGSTSDDGATKSSHKIDGIDDFKPQEKFATSSSGYEGFIAWDDKRLFFGMSG